VLQCVAAWYEGVRVDVAVCCSVLQYVLECVAVRHFVLQCVEEPV